MQEIPGSVFSIGGTAKTLDAKNNKLKELTPALSELENLQRLILANNLLTNLPHVASLKNLKVKSMGHSSQEGKAKLIIYDSKHAAYV